VKKKGCFFTSKANLGVPNLVVWGIGAVAGVTLYASTIPKFQNDVLKYTPFAWYYEDKVWRS
jgi:hypothetical protein